MAGVDRKTLMEHDIHNLVLGKWITGIQAFTERRRARGAAFGAPRADTRTTME
jgi:hypothetical protein